MLFWAVRNDQNLSVRFLPEVDEQEEMVTTTWIGDRDATVCPY